MAISYVPMSSSHHSNGPNLEISRRNPQEEYEIISRIGSGTYGDVYKVRRIQTSEIRAVKIIKLEAGDDFSIIQQEIRMMKECQHPNIVAFYGSYLKRDKLWIVMEFCGGGSLQDIYHCTGPLGEDHIAFVLKETLKGVDYLHSAGKIHRAIKGANILLTEKGDVKLADFGVSAQITATMSKRKSFIGTPYWMAPEVAAVERKGGYNHQCDIWAIGITAIELAELQPPMFDLHPMRALFLMSKSGFKPPTLKDKTRWSEDFQRFVKWALTKNPKKRPNAEQLLIHKFLFARPELNRELIKELLESLNNPQSYQNGEDEEDEAFEEASQYLPPQRISSKRSVPAESSELPTQQTRYHVAPGSSTSANHPYQNLIPQPAVMSPPTPISVRQYSTPSPMVATRPEEIPDYVNISCDMNNGKADDLGRNDSYRNAIEQRRRSLLEIVDEELKQRNEIDSSLSGAFDKALHYYSSQQTLAMNSNGDGEPTGSNKFKSRQQRQLNECYRPTPLSTSSPARTEIATTDSAISKGRKIYGSYHASVNRHGDYHRGYRELTHHHLHNHQRQMFSQLSQPAYNQQQSSELMLRRRESAASSYSEPNGQAITGFAPASGGRYLDLLLRGNNQRQQPQVNSFDLGFGYLSRGWSRESLLAAPFGQRGKETRRYHQRLYGSHQSLASAELDEPLVPKPTFAIRAGSTTTVLVGGNNGCGSGQMPLVGDSSVVVVMPPGGDFQRLPVSHQQRVVESFCEQQQLVGMPNGSPYHRLREFRATADSLTELRRPRPLSVASTGVGEERSGGEEDLLTAAAAASSYLTWSVDTIDKILANIGKEATVLQADLASEGSLIGPPPPAPPLPVNFGAPKESNGSSDAFKTREGDDDDNEAQQPKLPPPEVPPRQRRSKKANVGTASTSLNLAGTVGTGCSLGGLPTGVTVNGLPSTQRVIMGACFTKVFNECPLKVHCSASWVHPDTHDQHILLGCDEGIYCLNLNELADATLDQLYPRRTTWIYVIKNVMMSISGKAGHLYRHDMVQLYSKKNINFGGLPSTVDSMITKIQGSKFMPRKFATTSQRVADTKGVLRCCVGRNPFNGYKYLCGMTPTTIFLMQWYNPMNKFMLLKNFDYFAGSGEPGKAAFSSLRMLEMIILPGAEYPILVSDVRRLAANAPRVDMSIINLNQKSGAIWFDKDSQEEAYGEHRLLEYEEPDILETYSSDGTVTMVPAYRRHNLVSGTAVGLKQIDMETLILTCDNSVLITDLDGKIKATQRNQSSEFHFEFRVDSTVCLNDCILVFHAHGMEGRSLSSGEVVQDITWMHQTIRLLGDDGKIVLESRPNSLGSGVPSNLMILSGHEND